MGTRSGDIDPGVFGYLAERAGLTVDELTEANSSGSMVDTRLAKSKHT